MDWRTYSALKSLVVCLGYHLRWIRDLSAKLLDPIHGAAWMTVLTCFMATSSPVAISTAL